MELMTALQETIRTDGENMQRSMYLMKAIQEFMSKFRKGFCGDVCQRTRYQDKPCPVKRLADFLDWLYDEVKVLSSSEQEA